jgi:large subunit ribosomal protein L4
VRLDVVDTGKKTVRQIDLDDSVFGARVRPWLFWEAVRMQLANRRRGTQDTKQIGDVSGTGKKPYKQKGTGRARQGSHRSAQMRGGAVVHGPKPRDHSYAMPKQQVKAALRSALSARAQEAKLSVVTGWAPAQPKAKAAAKVIETLAGGTALVVGSKEDVNLMKSVRNLAHAKFLPSDAINVYDILHHDNLILTEQAVEALTARLARAPSRREKQLAESAAARTGGEQ